MVASLSWELRELPRQGTGASLFEAGGALYLVTASSLVARENAARAQWARWVRSNNRWNGP